MINHMVGAADTWGGALGLGAAVTDGYKPTGKPYQIPYPDDDGLLVAKAWVYDHVPYPLRVPKPPQRLDLHDMFPTSIYNAFTIMSPKWFEMLDQFKVHYRPDVMINFGSNSVMTMGNAEIVTENFLKKFNFIFSFQLYITEFEEAVTDIVLPDTCFLERYTPAVSFPSTFSHPQGEDDWGWTIRQPVIEPMYERRDFNVVMMDICKRLGILPKYYKALNDMTVYALRRSHERGVQAVRRWQSGAYVAGNLRPACSKTGSGRSTGSSMSRKKGCVHMAEA